MTVVERLVQHIRQGKWADLEELDKKFDVVESRLGFPAKKRYQCLAGTHDSSVLIIERQWASLAETEAAYERAVGDAEFQQLIGATVSIVESNRREFYTPLP